MATFPPGRPEFGCSNPKRYPILATQPPKGTPSWLGYSNPKRHLNIHQTAFHGSGGVEKTRGLSRVGPGGDRKVTGQLGSGQGRYQISWVGLGQVTLFQLFQSDRPARGVIRPAKSPPQVSRFHDAVAAKLLIRNNSRFRLPAFRAERFRYFYSFALSSSKLSDWTVYSKIVF